MGAGKLHIIFWKCLHINRSWINIFWKCDHHCLSCLSTGEENSDEASLPDVDKENVSEDESFSSSNEKYKPVFNKSDDTVSIVDCASVNTDKINYKKMFLDRA